jgi:hypothetical protein
MIFHCGGELFVLSASELVFKAKQRTNPRSAVSVHPCEAREDVRRRWPPERGHPEAGLNRCGVSDDKINSGR